MSRRHLAWGWDIPKDGWFDHVSRLIERWTPSPGLNIPVDQIRNCFRDLVDSKDSRIYHPYVGALTINHHIGKAQRDFQFAIWVACLGSSAAWEIRVDEGLWFWTPTGYNRIKPGSYDARTLCKSFTTFQNSHSPLIDVWSLSFGFPLAESWASLNIITKDQLIQLANDLRTPCIINEIFRGNFPEIGAWVNNITKVIVPLARFPAQGLKSSHDPDIPGVIFVDLFADEISTIELIVHESAHLYFRMAEFNSNLMDLTHKRLYWSPLRNAPRPLRGIFLAYHALAYICKFYNDFIADGFISEKKYGREREKHCNQMKQCESTLNTAIDYFTVQGIKFFEKIKEMAD